MTFSNTRHMKIHQRTMFCLVIILTIAGQAAGAMPEKTTRNAFQSILDDSLETIWAGRGFAPDVTQRQQTLKTMLATGEIKKAELGGLMNETFLSLLDRHKTTRYNIKTFPDRINALFSPHMNWEEIREIIWRALSSVTEKDAPIVFKVGTLAPPGTPWLGVPETTLIPEIKRLSDGRILVKIYGGGVMGDDAEILEKMDTGQLDTCGCTALGVLAASPEASALLLPGLFKNFDEVDYICEKFRKRLDEGFEKNGYILWAIIDTGFFYLFSKNKVSGLADIARQKVLTWFGIIETTLYQELGINPTPVAVPDIVASLNTGQTDINLAPAAWMLGMQTYQYSNYYINPPLLYSPAAVIVSARSTDRIQGQTGISAVFAHNIQEMIISEFNALEPEWKRQIRSYEEKSLKAFETKCGMKVITLSPEDQQALEKAGKAVQQKLAGKVFPNDLTNDIKKSLEAYRLNR